MLARRQVWRQASVPRESRRIGPTARAAGQPFSCPYNSTTMNRHTKAPTAIAAGAALSVLLAGCGLFSNPPSPAPSAANHATGSTPISTESATPSPVQLVTAVTLVAQIGTPRDWTAAGLTWKGIQAAATAAGAKSVLVQPVSNVELAKDIDKAAMDGSIVVTLGPAADPAMQAAATAHPETEFIEIGVAVPAAAPANLHGLIFDEAEAAYLGGYVAASMTTSAKIGFVADTKTDSRSINYAAGFKAGASQANPAVAAALAYVGTPDSPDKGRTAAAGLVKAGDTVIVAGPSLSGIGAEREACARHAQLVGLDTDLWQSVPDIRSCVVATVLNRYDVAVTDAIVTLASGGTLPTITTSNVASGGIALSDFHVALPAGFQDKLDAVVGALRNGAR